MSFDEDSNIKYGIVYMIHEKTCKKILKHRYIDQVTVQKHSNLSMLSDTVWFIKFDKENDFPVDCNSEDYEKLTEHYTSQLHRLAKIAKKNMPWYRQAYQYFSGKNSITLLLK